MQRRLQNLLAPAQIDVRLEEDRLLLVGPLGCTRLRPVTLYRPAARDVQRESAPDVLLVLTLPTRKALEAAATSNYLVMPAGACRIFAPGIALALGAEMTPERPARQVRLTGKTGVVAETLLLGGKHAWSVRELALASCVSPGLAHRVLARLEHEGLAQSAGTGPEKVRTVSSLRALAELWSQEEHKPPPLLRGFLYSPSLETLARQITELYPKAALGGTLAANLYTPVLTRVPPPLRVWVPGDFNPAALQSLGFERTAEGVNLEFVQSKEDVWRVHRRSDGLPRVSKARAWREIAEVGGRTQELADALLAELEG